MKHPRLKLLIVLFALMSVVFFVGLLLKGGARHAERKILLPSNAEDMFVQTRARVEMAQWLIRQGRMLLRLGQTRAAWQSAVYADFFGDASAAEDLRTVVAEQCRQKNAVLTAQQEDAAASGDVVATTRVKKLQERLCVDVMAETR